MLESSYYPYFLHHAGQTSQACYQESLPAENQHGSFKYLSYIWFSNRYVQVFFLLCFRRWLNYCEMQVMRGQ